MKNRREWVSSLRVEEIKPYLDKVKKTLAEKWLNSDISEFEELLHARENRIEYNEIYRVMLELYDGNGIYFSGMGKNNVCAFNYIHDVERNNGMIRLDDNSGYTIIENNVVDGGRLLFELKWDGKFDNNFALNLRSISNKQWYPVALQRCVFFNSRSTPYKMANDEKWVTEDGKKVTTTFSTVSNSIFYDPKRSKEFAPG
ncbi:MAG: hypothetical protein HC901_01475, partial [Bdellovibrionaceae bacterium]|nr:hypothetical protein [Pseudobdellovibrionaceae bacterium]